MTEAINSGKKLTQIDRFLEELSITEYYTGYSWGNNDIRTGFSDIFYLEKLFGQAAREGIINLSLLKNLGYWGELKAVSSIRIRGGKDVPVSFYDKGNISKNVLYDLSVYIKDLDKRIAYFGLTFISKLLRFSLSEYYGAIDTRIVSVFRTGGSGNKGKNWINLEVYGGSISKTPGWQFEYATWIFILRYIASKPNIDHKIYLPPNRFVQEGLREDGRWYCADVEMALYVYTHEVLR